MILKDFLPKPAFREFVRCYRIVHFEFNPFTTPAIKWYPPKPEECLMFQLRDKERIQLAGWENKDDLLPVVLLGQQTSIFKRFPGRDLLNFIIVFQPTALYRLAGIPSYELTNTCVNAEYVFSNNIRSTFEEMQQAKSYNEILLIADKFTEGLIKNVKKETHQIDIVSKLLMQHDASVSIDWLAKQTNLCIKQFKRKFNERAGINPKTFTRIIRFNKAYNLKNAHSEWDWLKVAIECNYYDYQHLAKDYFSFTGFNPNQLHQLELKSPESRLGLTQELYKSRVKPVEI